jgi:hypothetical protein
MIKHESSLSEQDDDSSSNEDDDQELALLMRKFSSLCDKIGNKGYSFDPNKKVFRQEEMTRTRHAIIVVRRDISLQIAPSSSRKDSPPRTSKYKNQVMMRRTTIRARIRALRGRKAITKIPCALQRRRAIPREALWLKLKNGSPMSPQVKMSQVKMKTLLVSSSPTIKLHFHPHLCASWSKVTQR